MSRCLFAAGVFAISLAAGLAAGQDAKPVVRETLHEAEGDLPKHRRETTYLDDKKHGETRGYDDKKRLIYVENYARGVLHGDRTWYYPDGKKFSVMPFANGKFHGKSTGWFPDGTVSNAFDWKDGVPHGKLLMYHRNGKLMSEMTPVNGKSNGVYRRYTPEGVVWVEGEAKDGKSVSEKVLVKTVTKEDSDWWSAAVQGLSLRELWDGAGVPFGGKRYKFYPGVGTWKQAKKQCEDLGGQLAVVTSKEQNEFLTKLVTDAKMAEAWLGATDEVKEGTWVWVDGTAMDYKNWGPGQPNNKPPGEHYLVLLTVQMGRWSDQPDKSTQHKPGFICEWVDKTDSPMPVLPKKIEK